MFGIKVIRDKEWKVLVEDYTRVQRELEDIGWIPVSLDQGSDQTRIIGDFRKMLNTCRIYYTKNPLAGHWVRLTTSFVFGEGLGKPKCIDEKVQEVVDKFWDDPENKKVLTGPEGQKKISDKLQYEGNLFFALFDDEEGNTRVRVFNTQEIMDIILDENDRMRPNFYKISSANRKYDFDSNTYALGISEYKYYPDISNMEPEDFGIAQNKLAQGISIYHVKINCDINDKFGIPELYRGIDWIKAHKDMAEDLATFIKSLSTLAWKKKIKGTPTQVNTLKAAFNAKTDLSNRIVSAGSTQYENEGIDTQPINTPTGGVKIGTDGLKQMRLMVCAAAGIFDHYFGDPSQGNLATATSMELPMVKKFTDYQVLWREIILTILMHVINNKVRLGTLPGKADYNVKTRNYEYEYDFGETIDLDFPPIIEQDLKVVAEALKIAKDAGLISDETAARLFLMAANQTDIDEEIKALEDQKLANEKKAEEIAKQTISQKGTAGPGDNPVQVKENQIAIPKRSAAAKMASKTNYVLQRMNGYKRNLESILADFKRQVKDGIRSDGQQGQITGNVLHLTESLQGLRHNMNRAAETYFPIAIKIGKEYLQSHITRSKIHETLFEANNRGKNLLKEVLSWNDEFIVKSLVPDMQNAVQSKLRVPYETAADFEAAINEAVDIFDSRIGMYVGAFWTVEERAVKDAGQGTGMMANFVGADDEKTCEGCAEAMGGNPYPIDECPEPGSHECHGNCRHAIQVVEEGQTGGD